MTGLCACLWSSTFACMHMAIWGPSIKKGEFPTVPHHLHSPTMAVASQAMLDGPPTLAVQHPHVHQKGEMNATTTTIQQQRLQQHNNNGGDHDDNNTTITMTTTQQQQQQHNNNNNSNNTT